MSDALWLGIIGVVVICLKEWFDRQRADHAAKMVAKVAEDAHTTAEKVQKVKETLRTTNEVMAQKVDDTLNVVGIIHTLVNNEMHIALLANVNIARRLADLTTATALKSGLPLDIASAKLDQDALRKAEELLKAHDAKQAVVDAGLKKAT